MYDIENAKTSYLWCSSGHNSPNQFPWLQATLSDLDEKAKAILALIQQEGDSFAQRAEMYYKRRPQLIKMVEDLHRSYICLAERYDHQLRSQSSLITQSGSSSSSNSFRHSKNVSKRLSTGSYGDSELMGTLDDQNQGGVSTEKTNGCKVGRSVYGEFKMCSPEREDVWSQMRSQVAKLMEDNLRQQRELIRRNDEKREAIKELCFQLDKVVDENRRLQSCLKCSKAYCEPTNQSQMSKLKALILGKLLGGGLICRN